VNFESKKTSPLKSLNKTCNLFEKAVETERSLKRKTYICKPLVEEGEADN